MSGLSSVYETVPVGYLDQGPFLNMAVRLETRLEPTELHGVARDLEAERSRERTVRNAPRTLDVDLLLYGALRLESEELVIPHPRMADRPFVLVPLLELDPGLADPVTGRPYGAMLKADPPGIRRLYPGERLVGRGKTR